MDLCRIAVVANSFWRMGEHQLRGVGVQHLSAMPRQLSGLRWTSGMVSRFGCPLGLNAMGESLTFEALTAIHYVHRLSAYVVFIALGALAWQLLSVNGANASCESLRRFVAFAAFNRAF